MAHRVRIKICGITTRDALDAAVDSGADAVGFVFYAGSARHILPADAGKLIARLPPFVTPVGLFVNASQDDVVAAVQVSGIQLLQLHGDETAAYCESASIAAGRPHIRAIRVGNETDLLECSQQFSAAKALLLDAQVSGQFGGTGEQFDWHMIPRALSHRIILSGGLSPANVAEAVRTVRPFAVDVSSGVEKAKGVKDPALIRAFCEAVHGA